MPDDPVGWNVVDEVPGALQAEILRGLLEANGLEVLLSSEAAGRAIGLGMAPMANVQLLVRDSDAELARRLLTDYYAGNLDEES